MAKGIIIAAPSSGSGKTLLTLGLIRALTQAGQTIAPAKTGPDYIDTQFLARAAGRPAVNLDSFAMRPERLMAVLAKQVEGTDIAVIEGVMGLFDGASGGGGSTADLAALLGLPIVLVIDCSHMAQSVAAIAEGFSHHRSDVPIAGLVLNKVASDKHEKMLREALAITHLNVLGVMRRDENLGVPNRHLGLVLPGEVAGIDDMIDAAAHAVSACLDVQAIASIAQQIPEPSRIPRLPPLGQRIAIARDAAFAFCYEHWLRDWRNAGVEISFFSPLNDEGPNADAQAVFLPGGYPELHGAKLAAAARFHDGMVAARDRDALIYGECGGYMVLGQTLTDGEGSTHPMTGLLPHATSMANPLRKLGYRHLRHQGPLPFSRTLTGHEFHYSSEDNLTAPQLFVASDAGGGRPHPMGQVVGKVCGSYAHVIDMGTPE